MPDGQRFYMRMGPPVEDNEAIKMRKSFDVRNVGLCGMPYAVLEQQAIIEQTKLICDGPNEGAHSNADTPDIAIATSSEQNDTEMDANNNTGSLWVEKFRPKNFLQLLSDDGTNRNLLKWLKLWDKVVFNKELKLKAPNNNSNSSDGPQPSDGLKDKAPPTEIVFEFDEMGRPKQKCALLYGPPGLGKTTLAHIIASTAGYNVVEMNASDDRSLEKFQEKLEAATQMKSVLNQTGDQRPNCLIIDEIDGSLAPIINFLVNLLMGTGGGSKSKKNRKKEIVLQRPIICICNDLYVPALRPLRQHALLVSGEVSLPKDLVKLRHLIYG